MSKIKVSAFFCEDMRIEENGKPMFIGILSPVINLIGESEFAKNLIFVTIFIVDDEINEFSAKLLISAENFDDEDADEFPQSMSKKFDKPADNLEHEPWMVISHLDLSGLTLKKGFKLKCEIEAVDYQEHYFLIAR